MLVSRLPNLRCLVKHTGMRLLATASAHTEQIGPVMFHRLTGADKGIAVYGLNSPADRNALGFELIKAMKEVNQLLREDTKVSVVILHSLVPGIFCAGRLFNKF